MEICRLFNERRCKFKNHKYRHVCHLCAVRTGSMSGGSSRIKVIEAAGMAAQCRWQTGVIAVQLDVAGTWQISKTLDNGIVMDGS